MKSKYWNIFLSIVIAFGLWLYVITVVNPNQTQEYYNVPVILEGSTVVKDRGMMILSADETVRKLELYGNRQNLNHIDANNLTLKADLTTIYDPGTYELEYTVSYPGSVPWNSVSVQNKEPGRITVVVAERDTDQIPVRVVYRGKVQENFILDKIAAKLDYENITITGPKDVVEQIDHAYIEVDLTGRTESISENYRYILRDADNQPVDAQFITTNVESVRLEVPIQRLKVIPLAVKVVDGGGATEETTTIVIDPVSINVSGSEAALGKLEELVIGTIQLSEITGTSAVREFSVVLPDGVSNLSGVSSAKVTLTFPELGEKQFAFSNIQTIHVPQGMEATLLTQQLLLSVRGPLEQIEALQMEDITVTVDLTGVENAAVVQPTITFAPGFEQVGAVGPYSISVSVAPVQPTEVTQPTGG